MPAQKAAFAGNAIALSADAVWMSAARRRQPDGGTARYACGLGIRVRSVPLDEIEKAGGSLRCCVGEIF